MKDERDDSQPQSEPHSPSSFKVGEVDRLSGFFTPVWESKRRLRAESPIPAPNAGVSNAAVSNAAVSTPPLSAPSSASGASSDANADSAARRPSVPPQPEAGAAPKGAFIAATPPRASRPPIKGRVRAASDGAAHDAAAPQRPSTVPPEAAPSQASAAVESPRAAVASSEPALTLGTGERPSRVPTPIPGAAALAAGAASEPASEGLTPAGAAARPLIPMPLNPGRTTPRAKPSSVPPAANVLAPRRSTPAPELREAPATSAPPARASWPATEQHAARVVASAVLQDKPRGKPVDSVDTFARHRETESEREALQRAAVRAAATPPEPYPSHLLRTLRRTLHLSMPLPEAVRAMIDKYR